jgi:hypothetical protein
MISVCHQSDTQKLFLFDYARGSLPLALMREGLYPWRLCARVFTLGAYARGSLPLALMREGLYPWRLCAREAH